MSLDLSRIEARLREQLCPDCVRYTSERTCSLPPDRKCALFKNLSGIVDVVRTTHSLSMGPYLDATRAKYGVRNVPSVSANFRCAKEGE